MRVVWSDIARQELREIVTTIADDNPVAAAKWIKELRTRAERLSDFPDSGRMMLDEDDWPIRELLYGNYRVLYEVQEQTVLILHVWHGARRLPWEDTEDE